jgi:hypothetical protein
MERGGVRGERGRGKEEMRRENSAEETQNNTKVHFITIKRWGEPKPLENID